MTESSKTPIRLTAKGKSLVEHLQACGIVLLMFVGAPMLASGLASLVG